MSSETQFEYFQKSKAFLFPILGIKKKEKNDDLKTYIAWEGYYKSTDQKLIVVVDDSKSSAYNGFQQIPLLECPLLEWKFIIDSTHVAYVFDLSDYQRDWKNFLFGCYDELSQELKSIILTHHDETTEEGRRIKRFLYPSEDDKISDISDWYDTTKETLKAPRFKEEALSQGEMLDLDARG